MTDDMQEIINDFVTEAEESLDRIDPLFVELETNGEDKEILNDIFRCMHTLKGAAGFLGFQPVVDVAHTSENILKRLREGEVVLTKRIVDAVLASVDTLRALIGHVKHGRGWTRTSARSSRSSTPRSRRRAVRPRPPGRPPKRRLRPRPPKRRLPRRFPRRFPKQRLPLRLPRPLPLRPPRRLPKRRLSPRLPRPLPRRPGRRPGEAGEEGGGEEGRAEEGRGLEPAGGHRPDRQGDGSHGRGGAREEPPAEPHRDHQRAVRGRPRRGERHGDGVVPGPRHVRSAALGHEDAHAGAPEGLREVPRIVRDLAAGIGKEVDLKITGEETEVDRSVIEHIGDPLVHIIRNAIDHGLESPEARRAKGSRNAAPSRSPLPSAGTRSSSRSPTTARGSISTRSSGRRSTAGSCPPRRRSG